jgi:hypothetical protein
MNKKGEWINNDLYNITREIKEIDRVLKYFVCAIELK